jgi:parallel beta-helix repeat (two copies)
MLPDSSLSDYIYVYGEGSSGQTEFFQGNKTYHWLRDGAPYRLTDHIYIHGDNNDSYLTTLKIYPQTIISIEQDRYIWVGHTDNGNYNGALQADSVTFTSTDTSQKFGSISFNSHSIDEESYLDNCVIEYANDGVYCASSDPTITNSTFRYNADGVEADEGASPTLTGNTFIENTHPVTIYAARIDSNLYDNTYLDNTNNYIEVQHDYLNKDRTYDWLADGAPYVIVGDVYVQRGNHPSEVSILKIHPGTVVKFGSDDHLYVGASG